MPHYKSKRKAKRKPRLTITEQQLDLLILLKSRDIPLKVWFDGQLKKFSYGSYENTWPEAGDEYKPRVIRDYYHEHL